MNTAAYLEIDGAVAIITINRPEARNAIDGAAALQIAGAVDRIETDPAIRVAILTGAGGNFCAGMDLKAFLRGEKVMFDETGFAGIIERRLTKPYIAAIEGYALAGGFEIALTCDLIIASTDAQFGLPEVKLGLVANAGGLVRLPKQINPRLANELVLTGDMIGAPRLADHGLINRLTPAGEALEVAKKIAARIAANGPLAVAASKRVMTESADWHGSELFQRQAEITAPIFESMDAREGATAFSEKRAPVWKNR